MKRAVVCFADRGHYAQMMKRLEQSLKGNFSGDFLGFSKFEEINCEPHSEIPFKFKSMAIQKAFDMGYESILWCDSQVYAKSNIDKVFDYLENGPLTIGILPGYWKQGSLIFDNIGFSIGDYTNDKTLNHFGITREQSWKLKMVNAKVFGLVKGQQWFDEYRDLANNLYPGEWHNKFLTESQDMRCKGHRHDQSVLSCLAYKYQLPIIKSQDTFFANESHRLVMPIADSVCLFAEG